MKNVLALGCILALGSITSLSGSPQKEPELRKLNTLKAEPLAVVQIGEEVRIVKKSEVAGLKKELDGKYRAAVKEYVAAQKEARKAKQEFSKAKPVKESLSILAASVKTQEDAEAIRDKAMNEYLVVKLQDSLKVIRKLEFASFKAQTEASYRRALASYTEAKKSARKSKQSFKQPAPEKPRIKVLATRLASEEIALEKMKSFEKKDVKSRKVKGKERKERKGDDEIEKDDDRGDDDKIEEDDDEDPERLE